jgi:hypothetical protein
MELVRRESLTRKISPQNKTTQKQRHMKNKRIPAILAATMLTGSAMAHISYTGRDFGTFVGDGSDAPVTLTAGNVSSAFGWADATDADLGDSHRTRAFRFKLNAPAVVTLRVAGATIGAATPLQFPAFSVYSGLAHVAPSAADHDASPVSATYLATLGGVQPKEGALIALGDWKVGNEDVYNIPGDPNSGVAVAASLSSLSYRGHAADGTAANYGTTPGINGDGLADNDVTGTFALAAGDYTVMIGGGNYAASIGAIAPYTNYGITTTITVDAAPERIAKAAALSAIPGATYTALYTPAINGAGTVGFRAGIKVGAATSSIIVRRTLATGVVARTGTTAAGTTANWKSFGDPVINENGELAFTGALSGATMTTDAGVWSDLGGALTVAVREGDLAPSAAAGQRFKTFPWINLQTGALYISATTSDGTVKGTGIWKWNGATLVKTIAPGDSITLLDGTTRVVKTYSQPASTGNGNATSRNTGADGTLALNVTFTDGTIETLTFR